MQRLDSHQYSHNSPERTLTLSMAAAGVLFGRSSPMLFGCTHKSLNYCFNYFSFQLL